MYNVLLAIHVMVTLALIIIILMQRSASDGMGLSGSSSTSFLSGRAMASSVTRLTAVLATLFILSSLGLGIIIAHGHESAESSIMDKIDASKPAAATPAPKQEPQKPTVPRPE